MASHGKNKSSAVQITSSYLAYINKSIKFCIHFVDALELFWGTEKDRDELATVFCFDAIRNKSSAVAEMGDRGHNRHGPKRGGCCAPFAERWEPV